MSLFCLPGIFLDLRARGMPSSSKECQKSVSSLNNLEIYFKRRNIGTKLNLQ
jgi:hypothetical protein